MKQSTITETIIKPLVEFGNSVGELAKAAPTYMPIPGTSMGGKDNLSFKSLGNV